MKDKTAKFNYITMKNSLLMKGHMKQGTDRQQDWEKIFTVHVTDKGLVARTYEESQTNRKERTQRKQKNWQHQG